MITNDQIKQNANAARNAGIPDSCNRWLKMTPEAFEENQRARDRIAATILNRNTKETTMQIGPKEQANRERRVNGALSLAAQSIKDVNAATTEVQIAVKDHKKKIHPADAANLAAIAEATNFTVSLYHGGEHIRHDHPTLAAARAHGEKMEKDTASNRRSIVYAVLKDGRSFPVPRDYQSAPATKQEPTMAKASTAKKTQPAKKTTAKPAPSARAKPKDNARKAVANGKRFDWKGAEEAAAKGTLPGKLDFSAETHTHFRPRLAEVEKLAKDRDIAALKKWKYDGFQGSSIKAVLRWRDLAVRALEAKA